MFLRARRATGHFGGQVRDVGRWVARPREHTTYTFDLTTVNLQQLAWWVAAVPVEEARSYIQ